MKEEFKHGRWAARPRAVSDIYGNVVVTSSYWAGNRFRIDPNVVYDYVAREDIDKSASTARNPDHQIIEQKIQAVLKIAARELTDVQFRGLIGHFILGRSWTELGRQFGCTDKAVREAVFGNSKGQGGALRKIKKILFKMNKLR